jgi:hypothetical protein
MIAINGVCKRHPIVWTTRRLAITNSNQMRDNEINIEQIDNEIIIEQIIEDQWM